MALVRMAGSPYWWIDITVQADLQHTHGKRIRRTTETADKKLAQQYHDKVKADLWRQDKLGERPRYTLQDAVTRWEKHAAARKLRDADGVKFKLDWWVEKLGAKRELASIRRADILAAVEGKTTIPKNATEKPRPATPATINRYLAAIRGLLRLASRDWDMIDAVPNFSLLPEPKGRVRTLDKPELEALRDALPPHLVDPFIFAVATGLRRSNVVGLRWEQVDMNRARLLLDASEVKNGQDYGAPLNQTAMQVLLRNKDKHREFVFTRSGRPLGTVHSKEWQAAVAKAGLTNLRWHDLRHVFCTSMIEAGANLDELQKLGGWKSRAMLMRYGHMRTEHLRSTANKIDGALSGLVSDRTGVVQPSLGRDVSGVGVTAVVEGPQVVAFAVGGDARHPG